MPQFLLEVDDLYKYFTLGNGIFRRGAPRLRAVDGVSCKVRQGSALGLVGESGCGKTTLGRCIVRLEKADAGKIFFDGQDLAALHESAFSKIRRNLQMIFQDPYSALDQRMTAGDSIRENFIIHNLGSRREQLAWTSEIMSLVGLRPEYAGKYPHEFSGGQRQRICIARAVALRPKMIIADEPVAALDMSVQAQILNLLVDLQEKLGVTYILISHNLGVVRHLCDTVVVMYLGKIVEASQTEEFFRHPVHPYARMLLDAVPDTLPGKKRQWESIAGDVPSPLDPPTGCAFHPRCPHCKAVCREEQPLLQEIAVTREVACHFPL